MTRESLDSSSGAVDANELTIAERSQQVRDPNDRRKTQLASQHRRVREHAAALYDDGRGARKQRRPTRIGARGDEDVTGDRQIARRAGHDANATNCLSRRASEATQNHRILGGTSRGCDGVDRRASRDNAIRSVNGLEGGEIATARPRERTQICRDANATPVCVDLFNREVQDIVDRIEPACGAESSADRAIRVAIRTEEPGPR
jgi:hypothetical protein